MFLPENSPGDLITFHHKSWKPVVLEASGVTLASTDKSGDTDKS